MAIQSSLLTISLCLLLSHLTFSLPINHRTSSHPLSSITDVHDILPLYNLPKGLVPDNVKSYTLQNNTGSFTIELKSTCYVHFDQLVYYERKITGKLSYGRVSGVSGIQAKKLFVWLPVSGIETVKGTDMVRFFVGAFSQDLPAKQFEDIPDCKKRACLRTSIASM